MSSGNPSCETCKFFEFNNPDDADGMCRRYPPQIYLIEDDKDGRLETGVHAAQPVVDKFFDWCGEYVLRQ